MLQAMKILDVKAAADKEWKMLETAPAWQLDNVKSQKGGYSGSEKRQKESPLDGHVSSQKMRSWNQSVKSTKARSCSEVTLSKTTQVLARVFTEQGSSVSLSDGRRSMDVTARLPDCGGQAADAVSANTKVKIGR